MEEESKSQAQSHAGWWALWVAVALVFYVLSWGPVKAYYTTLWSDMDGRPRVVQWLYYPADWLGGQPSVRRVSEDYFFFCLNHMK